MHIGFTGTQRGMTEQQIATIVQALPASPFVAHHGDCIGADAEFHRLARTLRAKVIGHIPDDDRKRAFCDFDEVYCGPLPYLERNRTIVDASDLVIAAPKLTVAEARSGTWSTVRYARKRQKPLVIVWPAGTMTLERIR